MTNTGPKQAFRCLGSGGFFAYKIDIKRPSGGRFSQIEGKIVIILGYIGHLPQRFTHYFVELQNTSYFLLQNIKMRYFLSQNVKIRPISRKKWHKLRYELTQHFLSL